MKLGLVSAIYDTINYEEMIDLVAESGLECVEVACWPSGKAERRYAGVSHIDIDRVLMDDEYCEYILSYAKKSGVEISALAYYPNTMDSNLKKRNIAIEHIEKVIYASAKLKVNMVTTFIGRDQSKNIEQNVELLRKIWPPILKIAENVNVKIAIENCPMLFGPEQWPGGQNLMTTPVIWRKVFKILNSPMLGLNYDPSHFVWQKIDYIKPLYEFRDKIFHVHFKDIKLFEDKLIEFGTMAYPLDYMSPKIPGLGDVNWSKYISALTDIGFDGYGCIEIEDRSFEDTFDKKKKSVMISTKYLKNYIA